MPDDRGCDCLGLLERRLGGRRQRCRWRQPPSPRAPPRPRQRSGDDGHGQLGRHAPWPTATAVGGYLVKRYDSEHRLLQTILSACTGTITALSCVESSVPAGSWKYTVTPVIGTNWVGAGELEEQHRHGDPARHHRAGQHDHPVQRHRRRLQVDANTIYYRGVAAGLVHADQRGDRRRFRTRLEPDRDPRQHPDQLDPHRLDGVDAYGRPLRLQHVQLDRGRDQLTHRGRDRPRRRRQHRRREPVVRQRLDCPERGHDQLPQRLPARPLRPGHLHHRNRRRLGHRHQAAPATVRSADRRHLWHLDRLQRPSVRTAPPRSTPTAR